MRKLKKEVWPHQTFVKIPQVEAIEKLIALDNWCIESIGKRFIDWFSYGAGDGRIIYAFRDEATLLVFKLTWGHYCDW